MDPQIPCCREAKTRNTKNKKKVMIRTACSEFTNKQTGEETDDRPVITSIVKVEEREEDRLCWSKNKGEAKSSSMAEKMKEIENMDGSNADHVVDIREFLYYYSRLTSPVFLGVVDQFFVDVYAEFLAIHYRNLRR